MGTEEPGKAPSPPTPLPRSGGEGLSRLPQHQTQGSLCCGLGEFLGVFAFGGDGGDGLAVAFGLHAQERQVLRDGARFGRHGTASRPDDIDARLRQEKDRAKRLHRQRDRLPAFSFQAFRPLVFLLGKAIGGDDGLRPERFD